MQSNAVVNLEAAVLGSYSALSNLVFWGPRAHPRITTPIHVTVRVWGQVSTAVNEANTISPHTPLWGNPQLSHFQWIPDLNLWAMYGIKKLQHIMPEGRLPFNTFRATFNLPTWMFFCYLQLRHAAQSQFPDMITVAPHVVERFLYQ